MHAHDQEPHHVPSSGLTPLEMLEHAIRLQGTSFDNALDRAFDALRGLRVALNGVCNEQAMNPEKLAASIRGQLQTLESDIIRALGDLDDSELIDASMGDLTPVASFADLRSALSQWQQHIAEQASALEQKLQDETDDDRLVEFPTPDVKAVSRKCVSSVTRLMGILQLRDSVDQRISHLISAVEIARTLGDADRMLVMHIVQALIEDLSEAVDDTFETALEASFKIIQTLNESCSEGAVSTSPNPPAIAALQVSDLPEASGRFVDLIQLNARLRLGPCALSHLPTACARSRALGQEMSNWEAWQCSERVRSALESFLLSFLDAKRAVDLLAHAGKEVAVGPGAPRSVADDNSALDRLWQLYTIDSERFVHQTILDRLAG